MKTFKEKIEEAMHKHMLKCRSAEDLGDYESLIQFDVGIEKTFKAGANFGVKEGFELACDYFYRRGEGHILFDLATEGKRLGILTGEE